MKKIKSNIHQLLQQISSMAKHYGRDPEEISLIAISKTQPVSAIEDALTCGQLRFGENYVQESVKKIEALANRPEIEWHFTGQVQSNKSQYVAKYFNWCHTLDRIVIAQRLHNQRPENLPPLNVLIQINISHEATKAGIDETSLPQLVEQSATLPRLKLRGLMAIPAPAGGSSSTTSDYKRMKILFDWLAANQAGIDTLSMGMSDDLEMAIAAGSTMLRIGTAIFGARSISH